MNTQSILNRFDENAQSDEDNGCDLEGVRGIYHSSCWNRQPTCSNRKVIVKRFYGIVNRRKMESTIFVRLFTEIVRHGINRCPTKDKHEDQV